MVGGSRRQGAGVGHRKQDGIPGHNVAGFSFLGFISKAQRRLFANCAKIVTAMREVTI
jgi:hypothetical protein